MCVCVCVCVCVRVCVCGHLLEYSLKFCPVSLGLHCQEVLLVLDLPLTSINQHVLSVSPAIDHQLEYV